MAKKNQEEKYMKFYELMLEIDNLKISEEEKENLARMLSDIQIDYERLKKSSQMKEEVYQIEKELILNGYIKKDTDANYLYNRLMNIENSKAWKIYQKMKKIKQKIVK